MTDSPYRNCPPMTNNYKLRKTSKQLSSDILFKHFYLLFLNFCLCWFFIAVRAFSSAASEGYSLAAVRGLLTAVASPVAEHGL